MSLARTPVRVVAFFPLVFFPPVVFFPFVAGGLARGPD